MINLSSEFITRSNAKDTRKLVLVHLYKDDINYLRISTVACIIDGFQYLPILKDADGQNQKWNLLNNNNVTVGSPSLTLINYNTPDNYQIVTEFFSNSYYGRKINIYYGYEGMSLSSMVKSFEGYIDEINFDNGTIKIEGKTNEIPTNDIQGRKLNYDNQTIGVSSVSGNVKILKENDGKYLPVIFGKHWCAPLQPYLSSTTAKEYYYAINDSIYSDLLKVDSHIKSDLVQYNIGTTGSQILINNDEAYTPLHQQGWYSDNEQTYKLISTSGFYSSGIKIPGDYGYGHIRTDNRIFVTVPLRYTVRNDLGGWFYKENCTTDSDSAVLTVFDNSNSPSFNYYFNDEELVRSRITLTLDMNKNLRSDEKSFIRKNRIISIPSTESNNGGQGYLLGSWYLDCDNQDYTYPFKIAHWKNNYNPSSTFSGFDDVRYLGMGNISKSDSGWIGKSYGARVFNKYSAYGWDYNIYDESLTDIGLQGTLDLNADGSQGLDPFLIRETLKEPLGALLIILKNASLYSSGDATFQLNKIFHLTAGVIDLNNEDILYASATGATLINSNSLSSTPRHSNNYFLQKPYEYLEFLLRKNGCNNLSNDFSASSITGKWNNFFSNKRDGSGFVIDKQISLDKFVNEYIKYEPFTIFSSEDGLFQFKMFKKTYSDGDQDGLLDFNDAKNFTMNLTPTKNIISEIKSLKTDFMYGLDKFVNDINWRISSSGYDYQFWKYGNTNTDNSFKIDELKKQYTSYTDVDTVSYFGKYYGATRTNFNKSLTSGGGIYWNELNTPYPSPSWSATANYNGEDAENYSIASWYINQWCNRHRTIKFETDNLSYYRFNIGDIVQFVNVPYTLLGMRIKGFNGATNFTETINGQTVYANFIITSTNKSLNRITIECMQLHDLNAFEIERIN